MKLILICFGLLSEVHAMPTQYPDVDNKVSCCGPDSQLVFQGHATKQGFNVFVFDFSSTNENTTPKVAEENDIYGSTAYKTEKPTDLFEHSNPYDLERFYGNGKGDLAEADHGTYTMLPTDYQNDNRDNEKNISDVKNSSTHREYVQNDSGLSLSDIFKLYGVYPGSTAIDSTIDPYTRHANITNGKGDLEDIDNTEGSALTDTPVYSETYGVTGIPTVHFHPKYTDINDTIRCSGHGKDCNDTEKHTPEKNDRQDTYATGEESTANPKTIGSIKDGAIGAKKEEMDSAVKVNEDNKKVAGKKANNGKSAELSKGHKKRNGKTRDAQKEPKRQKFPRGHRILDSSSESDSESESDERFY